MIPQGLAEKLVNDKLLSQAQIMEYEQLAQAEEQPFLHFLIKNQLLSCEKMAHLIANSLGLPLFDLNSLDPKVVPLDLVDKKLIQRHGIIPLFKRGNHLFIAIDDPNKQACLKEIQFYTGLICDAVVVETPKLIIQLNQLLHTKEIQGLSHDSQDAIQSEEAPVVQFVNKVIVDAIHRNASDIHFEPYEHSYRIRYRIDGVLNVIEAPPPSLAGRITSRLKIMSNLDISEQRIPQDGHFKMGLSTSESLDFRISTCPTIAGEKVVIRILDSKTAQRGVDALGFSLNQKTLFLKTIEKPQGMILVTGPTGSGKTVTLYTALNRLNTKERNISTVEDPVEIKLPGINQVNINLKTGLSFATTLRALLRQDPDIIMLGEIRDFETAEIAIKSAQTGHLVLSTLHTNSAAETLTRLLSMGIASFHIASSITLIIAQRLARKLCDHCKQPRDDCTIQSLIELGFNSDDELKSLQLYKACGCSHCHQGYRGRIGLFEILPVSRMIGQLIMSGANAIDILKQAQAEGMMTMYQSGLEQIRAGITSIEEVNRVTTAVD